MRQHRAAGRDLNRRQEDACRHRQPEHTQERRATGHNKNQANEAQLHQG